MDYVLTDTISVPTAQQTQFTEKICYLPDTRLCFSAPEAPSVADLPVIAHGYITFGCFQNLSKLDDAVLATWGQILQRLPNAKLRLQMLQLKASASRQLLLEKLQQHGIAAERVMLIEPSSREAYFAAHAEVDMMLDTFPYPGGTTTCEALWMGVPTITLAGETMIARQGASILACAGLTDWVAADVADYVEKAVHMTHDLAQLAKLRARLREQVTQSPLFDAPRFARNFEQALLTMWNKQP